MTFVITCGSIDLSVGATLCYSGMLSAFAMINWGLGPLPACLFALAICAVVGLLNGAFVSIWGLPPMIVTLGMQYVIRGLVNVLTQGKSISGFPESFLAIGQGKLLNIPIPIFIAAFTVIVAFFIFNYTTFGRSVIATGGNKETARLAGIDVKMHIIVSHVGCAVLAGLSGIITASRLGSAQASAGTTVDMYAIASVIVGGTSLAGGSGTIIGTVFGVSIMELLTIALTLTKVDVYWQRTVVGAIMIAAVFIDTVKRKKTTRSGG